MKKIIDFVLKTACAVFFTYCYILSILFVIGLRF